MAHRGRPYNGDVLPVCQLDQSFGLVLWDALSNDSYCPKLKSNFIDRVRDDLDL